MLLLARYSLLFILSTFCYCSPGDKCHSPEGTDGDVYYEDCLRHTCKKGVWRPSIDQSICCFNGEPFEYDSIISTAEDGCFATNLLCSADGIEMKISRNRNCSSPAIKSEFDDLKDLLQQQISDPDHYGCSNSDEEYPRNSIESYLNALYESHMNSFQEEEEILLIGPAYPGNLESEIFTLPSLTKAPCNSKTPVFPLDDYHGYVGTMTEDGPLVCGGTHSGSREKNCFSLNSSGDWVMAGHGMKNRRFGAASVQTEEGWWVTGGDPDESFRRLSSTEVWDGKSWTSGHPLPEALHGHCMTRINTTHSFLVGGSTNHGLTTAAYLYSKGDGWVKTESMKVPRYWHACGLHDGHLVFVAGGYGSGSGSSEYFDLETSTWYTGPQVNTDTAGGEIFSWDDKTYWVGQKNIWELNEVSTRDQVLDRWQWKKVASMKVGGQSSQVFIMKEKDCKDWL